MIDYLTARLGEHTTHVGAIGIVFATALLAASFLCPVPEVGDMLRSIGEPVAIAGLLLVLYKERG